VIRISAVLLGFLFMAPGSLQDQPVQTRLSRETALFAEAWVGRDVRALGDLMAEGGIRLHLPGEEHQLIRPRQAQAALEVFLGQYNPGRVEVNRISPTGEGSEEGFAEIRWITGSPGVAEPVIFTVFVGYGLAESGWAVTEIRVLF